MTNKVKPAMDDVTEKVPADKATGQFTGGRLTADVRNLVDAAVERGLSSLIAKLDGVTDRLTDYAEEGGSSLITAVTGARRGPGGLMKALAGQALGGVKSAAGSKEQRAAGPKKLTSIIESVDVGAPVRLVYDQWTLFTKFPDFTKKVEDVSQESDEKLVWRAKVFWSRREWESTIVEQVPDQRIIWRSKGAKGYVDGAVTFHELAPDLTRVVVVLEYHPKGLFERTGNIWRAQGRRVRLELKNFQRHVMTRAILHSDDVEGWRGEIRDGEVVDEGHAAEEGTEPADSQEPKEDRPRGSKSRTKSTGARSRRGESTDKGTTKRSSGQRARTPRATSR